MILWSNFGCILSLVLWEKTEDISGEKGKKIRKALLFLNKYSKIRGETIPGERERFI
jgi:hypothetical protein